MYTSAGTTQAKLLLVLPKPAYLIYWVFCLLALGMLSSVRFGVLSTESCCQSACIWPSVHFTFCTAETFQTFLEAPGCEWFLSSVTLPCSWAEPWQLAGVSATAWLIIHLGWTKTVDVWTHRDFIGAPGEDLQISFSEQWSSSDSSALFSIPFSVSWFFSKTKDNLRTGTRIE